MPYFVRILTLVISLIYSGTGIAVANSPESDAHAATTQNPVAPSSESIAAGRGVYENHCTACHGADGKGLEVGEYATKPADLQGTASLTWRYRDPGKRDSQWAYVPALRRVRARDFQEGAELAHQAAASSVSRV